MLRKLRTIDLIVKTCVKVKPDQQVLIVVDDYARSIKIGQQVAEVCHSEGAEVVMVIMEPRKHIGQEPPDSITEAIQVCDVFISVCEGPNIVHTTAANASREKGIVSANIPAHFGEAYYDREISVDDLTRIKERTEHIVEIITRSNEAKITSSYGTDLTMSLKGRTGITIHPLSGAALIILPDYAEAAVSPVEGSTEGLLVTEGGVRGWGLPLKEPLRLPVKSGLVTDVSGPDDYVSRFNKLLATDENASNCAAELGIGTTHTMPRRLRAMGVLVGSIHIAVGRNNDIGGKTFSKIHEDLILYESTVWLDDFCLIKDGELKIP